MKWNWKGKHFLDLLYIIVWQRKFSLFYLELYGKIGSKKVAVLNMFLFYFCLYKFVILKFFEAEWTFPSSFQPIIYAKELFYLGCKGGLSHAVSDFLHVGLYLNHLVDRGGGGGVCVRVRVLGGGRVGFNHACRRGKKRNSDWRLFLFESKTFKLFFTDTQMFTSLKNCFSCFIYHCFNQVFTFELKRFSWKNFSRFV